MKKRTNSLFEVSQPVGGDERVFKDKHLLQILDHPVANPDQFTGDVRRKKRVSKRRPADYLPDEDKEVYENAVELDDEDDIIKDRAKRSQIKLKIIDEQGEVDTPSSEEVKRAIKALIAKKDTIIHKAERDKQNEETELSERAVSQAQQKAAAIALAVKTGKLPRSALTGAAQEMINMSKQELEKFAKSSINGLPVKVWEDLDESMKLDKVNIVHHDNDSAGFAKAYVAGNKGDHRAGGPTDQDQKASEKFHATYERISGKTGFGGSGHDVYQHKTTGDQYRIDRTPNGKGFYGTDHHVRKLLVRESTELHEKETEKELASRLAYDIHRHNGFGKKVTLKLAPWEQNEETNLDESNDKLKEIHKEFNQYKQLSTNDVLRHHKSIRKISGSYTAQDAGGKLAMVYDLLKNKYGENALQQYFQLPKSHVNKLEETEHLDEISKSTLGSYAKKALHRGELAARMSYDADDDMGKIATKRLAGTKKAVEKMTTDNRVAGRIKGNIDRARKAAYNRYTDDDDQGKSYYAAQKGIAKLRENFDLNETDGRKLVDSLKSKGNHEEAGKMAFIHGLRRSYGPHFGMRSSRYTSEAAFYRGYDAAATAAKKTRDRGLNETNMTWSDADKLADKHVTLAVKHKNAGNMAGYRAHADVSNYIHDKLVNTMHPLPVKSTMILRKSNEVMKKYPPLNESTTLNELSPDTLLAYKQSAINRNKSDADDYNAEVKYTMNKYGHNHSIRANDLKNALKKRNKYISIAHKKLNSVKEDLNETFNSGILKLNDGSTVSIKKQDANLLNQMFKDLNPANKTKMLKVAMADKHGFQEILGFAREAI